MPAQPEQPVRDLFCDLHEGQPVLLEAGFTGSEQALTAPGAVCSDRSAEGV